MAFKVPSFLRTSASGLRRLGLRLMNLTALSSSLRARLRAAMLLLLGLGALTAVANWIQVERTARESERVVRTLLPSFSTEPYSTRIAASRSAWGLAPP